MAQRSAAIGYSSGEEKGQSLGGLLDELKAAHAELLASIAEMERATASAAPNLMDYAKARFHISRASLHRRTISREARLRLASCVSGTDEAIIAKLTVTNDDLAREGAAHIGNWTVDAVQCDWRGYRDASRQMRCRIRQCIEAEQRLLLPILKRHR